MPRKAPKKPEALLFLCLFSLAALAPHARGATPPPFMVQERQEASRITVYAEYLADDPGSLGLSDLLSGSHDNLFIPARNSVERLGYRSRVWWLRVALLNDTATPVDRFLEVSPGPFARLTLFRPDDSGYAVQHSGTAQDPPWADVRDRRQIFQVTLPPGELQIYYLRAEPALSMDFAIYLSTAAAQLERNFVRDLGYLLCTGLIVGLMLFNAARFYFGRNRAQLHYLLFQGAMLASILAAEGFLGMRHIPWAGLQPRMEIIGLLLALGFGALFARRFLAVADHLPGLDLVLRASAAAVFVFSLISLSLSTPQAARITYALAICYMGFLVGVGAAALRAGLPHARLYLLARSVLGLAMLLAFLGNFGVWISSLPLGQLVIAALAVESLLITVGLTAQRENVLQRQLQLRQKQLLEESTWQTRSETLARVSHEVRTPMSGILGMAELLADTPLTPNQKECVRVIHSAGENLLRIINDVLEYSRLEQGATDLNQERFDLGDAVMDALELFRERAEEKQIELIAHIHTNVPGKVEGDHGKLRQVLTNLLGACIRHTSHGELILDVSRDPSGLTDHLRFEFTGSALKHGHAALRVFAGEALDEGADTDGTTLGITIARQLVQAMDGKSGVRENRNRELVCWVNLPLPASREGDEVAVDSALLSGHSMLVVDDSSTVTRVIRQQALSWGMRVTVCHDPREALATIRTQANLNEPFDVVLLDHQMPGMNGMQLATRIHEDTVINHPLVLVMLTGVQDAPTATTARNVGIHQVLTKPVSGNRLKIALAEALGMLSEQRQTQTEGVMPSPGLRVLVAEDHVLSQKVIRGMLAKLGLTADIVVNGVEALKAVRERHYDIVLMDCEMPEMDGFEAARRIRDWERINHRPPVPIIALTAHILREHRERSMMSGMNAHVPKPVEIGNLSEVIVRFTAGVAGRGPDSPHATDGNPA